MGVTETAELVDETLAALPSLIADRALLDDRRLAETTRSALGLMAMCEAAVVALTAEANGRGVVRGSTATDATQWILRLAAGEPGVEVRGEVSERRAGPLVPAGSDADTAGPVDVEDDAPGFVGMEPARARRLAALAEAADHRRHEVVTRAVFDGRVATTVAATALRHVEKVAAVVPTASHDEIHGWFLSRDPGAGASAVRELTRRIVHRYAADGALDRREETLTRHERLSFAQMPCGMVQLVAELSPDHAAVVRHAVEALAAPAPESACCDRVHHRHLDGAARLGRDVRSPAKRRADALMLLVTRAAADVDDDTSVATSGAATLVVTVDLEHLTDRLRGLGVTERGDSLAPSTVRRLACEVGVIPLVLDGDSRPLDVGRRHRLVTGELRRAVIHRDRHCTFPGCRRPPPWCQVHHVVPWHAGGVTSLENSALLCQTHHTTVHQRGYAASVDSGVVRWDARSGSMAGWAGAA